MDILEQFHVLLLILFILILIPLLLRAKKRPNKDNYITVAVYCLFIIGSVIGILGHPLWGLLIILIVALFCVPILIAFTQKNLNAEIAEQVKKVDTSEPIKVKDLYGLGPSA